jgi:hypothetical protein
MHEIRPPDDVVLSGLMLRGKTPDAWQCLLFLQIYTTIETSGWNCPTIKRNSPEADNKTGRAALLQDRASLDAPPVVQLSALASPQYEVLREAEAASSVGSLDLVAG